MISVQGVHHVKVPVTDLALSRSWYESVLPLTPHLEFPDPEGTVRGVVYAAVGGLTPNTMPIRMFWGQDMDLSSHGQRPGNCSTGPEGISAGPGHLPISRIQTLAHDAVGVANTKEHATMTTTSTVSDAYRVMQRIFDEGFATGNDSIVDEVCAPDLLEHQFGTSGAGAEAIAQVKTSIRDVHRAFPDIRFSIEDSAEAGDTIWVRVRGTGTATGPYFGPPSGRPIDFTVIDIARVVDHRIVEHWGVPDRFAVLVQTGLLDRIAG